MRARVGGRAGQGGDFGPRGEGHEEELVRVVSAGYSVGDGL